jgi:hypothetical protein
MIALSESPTPSGNCLRGGALEFSLYLGFRIFCALLWAAASRNHCVSCLTFVNLTAYLQ